ncbi:MAG: hypothetical protein K6G91_07735 [Kiritimatiellae bacterium]|nr:hypothetical protein [Kiritimatiellia bacterium]
MMSIAPFLIIAATTAPLRNPFWPVGHAGTQESISDEVRVVIQEPVKEEAVAPEPEPEPEKQDVGPSEDELWKKAQKTLKIGGKMKVGDKFAITINGKIYKEGNFVAVTVDGKRFIWKLAVSDKGKLTLRKVRIRDVAAKQ